MSKSYVEEAEHTLRIVRDACALIEERTQMGETPQQIIDFLAPCQIAKDTLNHLHYKLEDVDNDRQKAVVLAAGLRLAAEFIENNLHPSQVIDEAYVVETQAERIIDQFNGYDFASKDIPLSRFLGSWRGACAKVQELISKGLTCVTYVSNHKIKGWRGKPVTEEEELPKSVYRGHWKATHVESVSYRIRYPWLNNGKALQEEY